MSVSVKRLLWILAIFGTLLGLNAVVIVTEVVDGVYPRLPDRPIQLPSQLAEPTFGKPRRPLPPNLYRPRFGPGGEDRDPHKPGIWT